MRPPVLAWMVGDKTVNGATGEIIDFDVTGYIKSYNAQWVHAAKGLRALMQSAQGGSSSSSSFNWADPYAAAVTAYWWGKSSGTEAMYGAKCP